jgi:phosphoglycerate dehydrogenase-like enzyme
MNEHIFLTKTAFDRWWPDIQNVAPDAHPLIARGVMPSDEQSKVVLHPDRAAEIAWITFDVWESPEQAIAFYGELAGLIGLQWCHSGGAGADGPPFDLLASRGTRLSTSHVNAGPAGDFVVRAVLDVLQGADVWRTDQKEREWRIHDFREMSMTTWLVVGMGAIGQSVAKRVNAFGATVIGCRRSPTGDEPCERMILPNELLSVVPEVDVVVLSAPATSETRQLVDANFLSRMREGSILVNVARGTLVDEAALLTALDIGRPAFAILDTFVDEPLSPTSPFWSHPRVAITPHNAARGDGNANRAATVFLDNLSRWRHGEPLVNESPTKAPFKYS